MSSADAFEIVRFALQEAGIRYAVGSLLNRSLGET